jgi:hypothetical protein
MINMKNIVLKKILIKRNARIIAIAFLSTIILFSLITAYGAYQEPTTINQKIVTYEYTQNGIFDFTVNLKNNSWSNKTTIKPGEEIIFKKIVDGINVSLIYIYQANEIAENNGEYLFIANVKTDQWEKDYIIISKTNFYSDKNNAGFTINFPIDITYYENIVNEIDNQLGIKSNNPTLNLKCNVIMSSITSKGVINESFSPSITILLGKNTLEFENNLVQSQKGALTEEKQVFLQNVIDKRNILLASLVIFISILFVFMIATKNDNKKYSMEKSLNKIKKKYEKWIIESDKIPLFNTIKTVSVKSINDLIKTSVEMGKPVIHYRQLSNPKEFHVFYIFDESITYEYVLK